MKIFFDFEFIENGDEHPMIPISLGMVRDDGKELYLEFGNVDWSKANPWVIENVKPYLTGHLSGVIAKEDARKVIVNFCGEKPEFWAYFADYDWVLLCQIYGRMVDLPQGWPMWCRDLKQLMWQLGKSREDIPITNSNAHSALADAHWNREVFNHLQDTVKPDVRDILRLF